MKGLNNKNINKIKLTLTTRCNLSCPYCFVNKTSEDMGLEVAMCAIKALIASKGKEKLLSLYGGEAILMDKLLYEIIPYARKLAKRENKKITITVCSNGTLLTAEHVRFFRKNKVKLIISLAGNKNVHDSERVFPRNVKSCYDVIVSKLPELFSSFSREDLGIAFCIFPGSASSLFSNFKHLISLGFRHINFEIIRNYKEWKPADIIEFQKNYLRIINYVLVNLRKKNYIYINTVNWRIRDLKLDNLDRQKCPFEYDLEVYPTGDLAFSPFLLNLSEKSRYIVGNVCDKKLTRYAECGYSQKKNDCQICLDNYYRDYSGDEGANSVQDVYNYLSGKLAVHIANLSKSDRNFSDYSSKAATKIYF